MYMPSIFGENLLDDWMPNFDKAFDDAFYGRKNPLYGKNADRMMKTDVRELEEQYEVDMDLPGFKKDEIQVSLENGYLTVSAAKGLDKEEKDKKDGKVIRKERYSGSMTRSFYVGDVLKQEDIKARFEDGVLRLTVPKKDSAKEVPENKYIAIEG
ncbi:MAG: Hsp20/alpha crystallin family protein [Lachnospiraceae bacterium]|nr:Hsp20/alpha crystallin family protein [Lachnospiraceae bacterium]